MGTIANLMVKLGLDGSDYEAGLSKAQSQWDTAGKKMNSFGKSLSTTVTAPLVAVGAAAIAAGNQINAGMANVASLGLASDRVTELKGDVQDMAIAVGKSTTDLADGLYQVVSAFGDSADSANILEINAKSAAAGLATTTDAINLTSAVTKGYGDVSAATVQHAADLAFQTVKLGQTTFPELASSIGKVVPLAASLGVAQEELFGVMATGTGVTGTASEVATQLRGIMQSLMAPTADMTELLGSMGYESGQAMLEQLGLQGTIEALVNAAESSGTPLQKYISSIEGQTLAMALAGPQADTFTEKLAAMSDVTGAANDAFAAQSEGINKTGFTMQQAAVKGQVLLEKLSDGLAPALSKLLDLAAPWIDRLIAMANNFANADESTQTWILTIGAVVAAIGPLLMILGSLISSISAVIGFISGAAGLVGGLGTAGAALAAFATGPIGLTVAAVAGLALAYKTNFLGIRDATTGAVSWIGNQLNNLRSYWANHSRDVKGIVDNQWSNVRTTFELQWTLIRGTSKAALQFMQGDWQGGMETLRTTAGDMWGKIRTIYQNQLDNIKHLFAFFGWADLGEDIARGIGQGITDGLRWIRDAATRAAQSALDAAQSWLGINSPSSVAADEIGEPFGEGIGVGASRAIDGLTGALGSRLDALMGGLQPTPAAAGAGPGMSIQLTQNFYGQADAATVEGASRNGIVSALRQVGVR